MKQDYPSYKSRWTTVKRNGIPIPVCLIAVPFSKDQKKGFIIYATENPETFYLPDHKPLIGALLFDTIEQAFEAGELVLNPSQQQ